MDTDGGAGLEGGEVGVLRGGGNRGVWLVMYSGTSEVRNNAIGSHYRLA